MHQMANEMKSQRYDITLNGGKHLLNEWKKFGEYVVRKTKDNPENTKVISGESRQSYSIYFDFTPQRQTKASEKYKYSYQFNNK
ncbi:hypothetical protein ACLKA6_004165 [Drosophila palustris]